jgi:DNA-binding MarR family transcriptional regulator
MELRRRFAGLMGNHGLATHHFGLLGALGERGSLPQRELIRNMGVDPRKATAIVDELEEQGLITRRQDGQDRRRCNVAITPDGNKVVKQIRRDGARIEKEFFQSLDISERSMLYTLLLKLYQGLAGEE